MTPRLRDLLRDAADRLAAAGIMDPGREARRLVAHAARIPLARLTLDEGRAADAATCAELRGLVARREAREPLSHLIGYRPFYEHEFEVTPDVLDPRPETETLVRAALDGPFDHVLDLGTGSGAILLSLLAARPGATGTGTDISAATLRVAARNADRMGLSARCTLLRSDWFEQVNGPYDLIVANPPYIAADEMPALAPEIAYEPRIALTDEGDGLSAYRMIVRGAAACLAPGGRLMLEIGWRQGDDVAALLRSVGFEPVGLQPDLEGRDRVVHGVLPG